MIWYGKIDGGFPMPSSFRVAAFIIALLFFPSERTAAAESSLLGYNTNGDIYQVNPASGELTLKAQDQLHSFTLGAIARKGSTLYYIAAPAGATENAIYTANTSTATVTHADLDLSDDDDNATQLFFFGNKLIGLFYNSTSGTFRALTINPTTGATTLKLDLTSLDVEPIGGSIARIGKFFYLLAKPGADGSRRQLVRFKVGSNSAKVFEVQTKGANAEPVLCDRIKLIRKSLTFFCLASPSSTQVDTYRVTTAGRAVFLSTMTGIERIAGGHTLVTPNEKVFYAFVYATGETNNQRLIKLSASGQVKANVAVNTLLVGARFGAEEPEEEQ